MNRLLESTKIPDKIPDKIYNPFTVRINNRLLDKEEFIISPDGVVTILKPELGTVTVTSNCYPEYKFKSLLGRNYYKPAKRKSK